MPKVKPPPERPVAAARAWLREADVRGWHDIDLDAIAAKNGLVLCYGKLDTARGSIVRTTRAAVVWIDERFRGTPRARFTGAHECGHHALHAQVDHWKLCVGEEKRHEDFVLEREASAFSTELVMPEEHAAPICGAERPTLEDVARLARKAQASLQAAAIRYVELAKGACAVALFEVTSPGVARVKWGPESAAFPGRVVKGRAPHPASIAARLVARGKIADPGPREVPPEAWGALTKSKKLAPGTPPFIEHAIGYGRSVLSWIVPAR